MSKAYPYGPGAAFARDLQRNPYNPKRCEQVKITPDPHRGYAEFPDDPQLQRFDRSDRKFVAVARASTYSPAILNATDTDWWPVRECLERHGVSVEFLCPDLMLRPADYKKRRPD